MSILGDRLDYGSTEGQPTAYSETNRPETRVVIVPEVQIDITPATPVATHAPIIPHEEKVEADDQINAAEEIITAREVRGVKGEIIAREKLDTDAFSEIDLVSSGRFGGSEYVKIEEEDDTVEINITPNIEFVEEQPVERVSEANTVDETSEGNLEESALFFDITQNSTGSVKVAIKDKALTFLNDLDLGNQQPAGYINREDEEEPDIAIEFNNVKPVVEPIITKEGNVKPSCLSTDMDMQVLLASL